MPSSPTRRAVLAACGAGTLAGCTSVLGGDSSSPDIECGPPGDKYAWPMAGYAADRTSRPSETDLPDADAEAVRLSQTNSVSGGLSSFSTPAVGDGTAYVAGDTKVAAYDLETGDERWGFDPDRGAQVPPALGCETLYVSTVEETLALFPRGRSGPLAGRRRHHARRFAGRRRGHGVRQQRRGHGARRGDGRAPVER